MASTTATPKTKRPAKSEDEGPSSQSILGSFLKDHKHEHFAHITPKHTVISTGSLILDSLVKVRSGGVVRLVAKSAEAGKTSQAFVFADNYMKTMPKAKTLYVKAESRLTPEIVNRSGLRFVFSDTEWTEGTVYALPCNIFEAMAELLESVLPRMHELGEHLCIIIDSLDGLMLRADKAKDVWSGNGDSVKVAGVPLLTKLLFRRLGLPITHYDALLLVTGQYSADIKLDPYGPAVPRQAESAGGNSIAHQSDYVFQYLPRLQGDLILETPKERPDYRTNKTLGINATLEIKKSGTDVTGSRIKIPIKKGRVGCAIWIEREVAEALTGWEYVIPDKDGSSWLRFVEPFRADVKTATGIELPERINGKGALFALLDEDANKPLVAYVAERIRSLTA